MPLVFFRKYKTSLLFLCMSCCITFSQWDRYPAYSEYTTMMEKFQEDYPEICKIVEFGKSVQGRKLLTAKISDNANEEEKEPAFLCLSTLHGDELVGYVLMLHLIDYLLSEYGKNKLITSLVDSVEIWINPLSNPDGVYYGGNSTISGARRNNANNIDLNRNFPYVTDIGNSPDQEIEIKSIIDFAETHHFVMSADLHAGAEAAIYPWCCKSVVTVDNDWWRYVAMEYAYTAQGYSPVGYFDDKGWQGIGNGYFVCCYPMLPMNGVACDYFLYYKQCRNLYLELSETKKPAESRLDDYWQWNYQSLLDYIKQSLNGIKGTVTDELTGEPLNAKVFVENHDKDSSHVYSHLPHGDYYRPIYEGRYDFTFSSDGYYPKTVQDVQIKNDAVTIVDVMLTKISSNINPEIINLVNRQKLTVNGLKTIEIYDLLGRKITTLPVKSFVNWKDENGVYVVRLIGNGFTRQIKTIIKK